MKGKRTSDEQKNNTFTTKLSCIVLKIGGLRLENSLDLNTVRDCNAPGPSTHLPPVLESIGFFISQPHHEQCPPPLHHWQGGRGLGWRLEGRRRVSFIFDPDKISL